MSAPRVELRHKEVTILGGTGTLGQALIRTIREEWPHVGITVVSRDEHKQAALKRKWPSVDCMIGDIKDPHSIEDAFKRRDIIFHVAALKHVDILESNPLEAIKTNVDGTVNAARLAIRHGVGHFLFSSTDKAVDPVNAYGYSKAMAEKVLYDLNLKQATTRFGVYRWGNVIGSQGSVIPVFVKTLKEERKAYVTHQEMTRFWIPIEWTTRFMLRTFQQSHLNRAMVLPTMKSARVLDVIDAIADILHIDSYEYSVIGMRPGEKLHEQMISQHELDAFGSDTAPMYSKGELIELLEPIVRLYA